MAGKLKPNKEREAIHFHLFQKEYPSFQKYVHGDNPDFLVTCGSEILGIEFTEIYKEEQVDDIPLRQFEARKDEIVESAEQKAINSKLPPLYVSVHFGRTVAKERKMGAAEDLFQIVKNNCPPEGGSIELDFNDSIPDEFHAIHIHSIPGTKKHFWQRPDASWINSDFSGQLQNIILAKAGKLPRYLERCSKCWLVIAALGVTGSSLYEFSDPMGQHSYNSPFEKVFFLDAFSGHLKELHLNKDF